MEPTEELVDELFRERVLRARRMTPEQKLEAGGELFTFAAEITKSGIRYQFPDANEEQVQQILRERLALRKRLEEQPWN